MQHNLNISTTPQQYYVKGIQDRVKYMAKLMLGLASSLVCFGYVADMDRTVCIWRWLHCQCHQHWHKKHCLCLNRKKHTMFNQKNFVALKLQVAQKISIILAVNAEWFRKRAKVG